MSRRSRIELMLLFFLWSPVSVLISCQRGIRIWLSNFEPDDEDGFLEMIRLGSWFAIVGVVVARRYLSSVGFRSNSLSKKLLNRLLVCGQDASFLGNGWG